MRHPPRDPSLTQPTTLNFSGLNNNLTAFPDPRSSTSFSSLPFRHRQNTELSMATSPFPSQEATSTFVNGQFSDADSDQDPTPPEPKRQRLDGHSRLNNQPSQIPRFQIATSLSHSPLSTSLPPRPSNVTRSTTVLPLAVHHPSIRASNAILPIITQNPAKLPSSVHHRLPTLAGIQKSSKPTINSTSLSSPLDRAPSQAQPSPSMVNDLCPHNDSGPLSSVESLLAQSSSAIIPDHYLRALSGFSNELGSIETIPEGTALIRSSRAQATLTNRCLRNLAENGTHHQQQADSFQPNSTGKDQPSQTSYNPTSTTTISGNTLNHAHLSPALFHHHLLHALASPPENTTISEPNIDPILVAPKFTQSTSEPGGFAMPARGTFSIPAPSSIAELQALHSGSPPIIQLPHSNHHYTSNSIVSLSTSGARTQREASPQSAHQPANPNDDKTLMINNAFEESTPSEPLTKSTRKSKARVSKKKAKISHDQVEDVEQEVELVKPPPTINGKVSHGRKVPPGYVKRTPNSFIMFRSHVIANKLLPPGIENDNRQISRIVSGLWAGLSEDDLRTWQTASRELRVAARAKNPDIKNPPINKRKAIVRRKRSGQLPGETSEQRVEREKARAAALAKVIIDARGERLDKDKFVELAGISVLEKTIETSSSRAHDVAASRDASRPEFRAPQASIGSIAVSECAESTLTTSPYPNSHRMLTPMLESVTEDLLNSPSVPVNLSSAREKNPTKKNPKTRKAPASLTKTASDSTTTKPSLRFPPKAAKSGTVNEDQISSVVVDHSTKEPLLAAQSVPVVSGSMEQSNAIDLAAFSSLFESVPEQMESSTAFPGYAQDDDAFQSFNPENPLKKKHTSPMITTAVSLSSETNKKEAIVIDPSILTMTCAAPIETRSEKTIITTSTSEPTITSGFWSNTTTPMILNQYQPHQGLCSSNFIINGSSDDYSSLAFSGRATDQAITTTTSGHHPHQRHQQQQGGEFFPSLDILSQFPPSNNNNNSVDLGNLLISQQYSFSSLKEHHDQELECHNNNNNNLNHNNGGSSGEFNFESLYLNNNDDDDNNNNNNHNNDGTTNLNNSIITSQLSSLSEVNNSSQPVETEKSYLFGHQSHHQQQQQQRQEEENVFESLDSHQHQHQQSSVIVNDDDNAGDDDSRNLLTSHWNNW